MDGAIADFTLKGVESSSLQDDVEEPNNEGYEAEVPVGPCIAEIIAVVGNEEQESARGDGDRSESNPVLEGELGREDEVDGGQEHAAAVKLHSDLEILSEERGPF